MCVPVHTYKTEHTHKKTKKLNHCLVYQKLTQHCYQLQKQQYHKLPWRHGWWKARELWGWDPWWECWDSHRRAIQMRGERHSYCSGLKKEIMANHVIWKIYNLICLVSWPSFLEYLQNSEVSYPKKLAKTLFSLFVHWEFFKLRSFLK